MLTKGTASGVWSESIGDGRPVNSSGGSHMKTMIRLWNDESGASAAEYALILAIVGAGIAIAALTLGNTISNAMNSAGNCITDPTAQNCS
jgi:pilus assembly protein Flp/PilA